MEQSRQEPDEFVENETVGRYHDSPTYPIDSERCRIYASADLCVSNGGDLPESSTLTRYAIANQYSLIRTEMAQVGPSPILRSPNLRNESEFRVEEAIARNIGYHSSYIAGCSSSREEIDHEGSSIGWRGQSSVIAGEEFISLDKDSLELSSKKELKKVLASLQDVKVSPVNQNNTDSTNNISPSNLRRTSASSFSNFFLGRYRNSRRKSICNENPISSNESQTTSIVQHNSSSTPTPTLQNENVTTYASGKLYDALTDRDSLSCQLHSHDISRDEFKSPRSGFNLREWLESKGVTANKHDKMLLFRKIVEIVDAAHNRGIALLEVQPSNFILFETGVVKYIGSLMTMESLSANQDNAKKRSLELGVSSHDNFRTKMQNLGKVKLARPESHLILNQEVQDASIYDGTFTGKSWLTSENAQLEKEWYAFPKGFDAGDLLSLNIYSLGLLLFEFLCHFESIEAHSAAMLDLHHRVLPPVFLSRSHKEAGLCFWLLHPKPCSRPTTREILESDLMPKPDAANQNNDQLSYVDTVDDAESDLLLHFLVTLKEDREKKAYSLSEIIKFLDSDIKMVESGQASTRSLETVDGGYDTNTEGPFTSISRTDMLREKLLENMNELENAYFSMRSNQLSERSDMARSDKDLLWKRDNLPSVGTQPKLETEGKSVDRVGTFFNGICKFARYNKFEVCGTLRNGDILNSSNVICSLCFDPEEDYIAAAGVSKKIKIFEVESLLNDFVDVQYPVLEMSSESKFSCICWNNYIKSYLASTDYDGVVQIWDTSSGQGFEQHKEHTKRAWSIDFSRVDPRKFASGGDDCSLKLWSINEKHSTETIWSPANICCVQFSSYSSHLLAFGSADYRIYCYDLRHTRIPWCTLSGHENAVSYVRFLDAETIVSASTDNTLKLWDLKSTSLEGLSPDSCSLTFRGHSNEKNFVGLTVLDGYIACGSETNEVYAYYRSLPVPIARHKFGCVDPISGDDNIEGANGHFVSSVCWRRKSQMIAAANSSGSLRILRLAKSSNVTV